MQGESRDRTLRRSVVQVVAAFSPLMGCEGNYTALQRVIDDAAPQAPGCATMPECPMMDLDEDAACSCEGQQCDFDFEDDPYYSKTGTCKDGVWHFSEAIGNPPIFELENQACPDAPPHHGTRCELSPERTCSYPFCDSDDGIRASCEEGRWNVSETSCNPPPNECGTYGDDCDIVCPQEVPFPFAPCAVATPCEYGNCYGSPTHTASCENGHWAIEEVSCNPPAIEPCELPLPVEDAACEHEALSCTYPSCLGFSTGTATCTDNHWVLQQPECFP